MFLSCLDFDMKSLYKRLWIRIDKTDFEWTLYIKFRPILWYLRYSKTLGDVTYSWPFIVKSCHLSCSLLEQYFIMSCYCIWGIWKHILEKSILFYELPFRVHSKITMATWHIAGPMCAMWNRILLYIIGERQNKYRYYT